MTLLRRIPHLKLLVGLVGVVALIVVADLLGALRGGAADEDRTDPLLGRDAPVLTGTTLAGRPYRWHAGRVTVVNVWASWCGPCRDEVPLIARFARRWASRGVQVVTVDSRDGVSTAREFLADVGATSLLAVHDPKGRLAVSWGATGIPETFVVDRRGVIRAHRIGEVDTSWLTEEADRWT
ncbi:TlpA disulfide reductase family protein [Nocardioides sp. KR10-350]|uniref:TlpA family protein disulfide reductase n=1 Tax=Nocardioides cheoyonin TaxID=3156615 RepID=UPI0032B42FEB